MDEATLKKLKTHAIHVRDALEQLQAGVSRLSLPVYEYGGLTVALHTETKAELQGVLVSLADGIAADCDAWIDITGRVSTSEEGLDAVLLAAPTEIFTHLTQLIDAFDLLDRREAVLQADKSYGLPDMTEDEAAPTARRVTTLAQNAKRLSLILKEKANV